MSLVAGLVLRGSGSYMHAYTCLSSSAGDRHNTLRLTLHINVNTEMHRRPIVSWNQVLHRRLESLMARALEP